MKFEPLTLDFDHQGNLVPYRGIATDLLDFEESFVNRFSQSVTRKKLFDNYTQLLEVLPKEVVANCKQWIDGSYVTSKINPNDLDLVVLVNYQLFERHQLIYMDTKTIKLEKGLDVYFVRMYPVDHPYYFRTQLDENEWETLFSFNRQFQSKGFIKISQA